VLVSATMNDTNGAGEPRQRTSYLAAQIFFLALGGGLILWAAVANRVWFERHVLLDRCTLEPQTVVWEHKLRIIVGIVGLAVLALVRPRVARWAGRYRFAAVAWSSASIALAIILAVIVVDQKRRHDEPIRMAPALADPRLPPMREDAALWYVHKPSASNEIDFHGLRVRYSINAQGNRASSVDDMPSRSAPTILITGESVGLGYDLPYEKTCAPLIAEALGVQVVNVSVTGYANDQAYRRLIDALAWFEHPIATVTFFIKEQLDRNVSPQRARLKLNHGRLELVQPTWLSTSPILHTFEMLVHTDEAIPLTRAIFERTAEASLARGARPLFIMTNYGPPCLPDSEGTIPLARALFDGIKGEYAVVEVKPSDYDMHPNEIEERKLADAIIAMLKPRH
jgi:hypothetical protein